MQDRGQTLILNKLNFVYTGKSEKGPVVCNIKFKVVNFKRSKMNTSRYKNEDKIFVSRL